MSDTADLKPENELKKNIVKCLERMVITEVLMSIVECS
jgi:hypothetical protein